MRKTAVRIMVALVALMAGTATSGAAGKISVKPAAIAAQVKANPSERDALVKRFNDGDGSLTPAQMAVVYYGEAFTPGYTRVEKHADIDAAYAAKDWAGTLRLVDKALASNPVMLNQLFRGYVSSRMSVDDAVKGRAATYQNRINSICDLIYSTGTGVSDDSPFLVLSREDAMAFVRNYLQPIEILGTSAISGMADMTAVKVKWPEQQDPVIFYFKTVE